MSTASNTAPDSYYYSVKEEVIYKILDLKDVIIQRIIIIRDLNIGSIEERNRVVLGGFKNLLQNVFKYIDFASSAIKVLVLEAYTDLKEGGDNLNKAILQKVLETVYKLKRRSTNESNRL